MWHTIYKCLISRRKTDQRSALVYFNKYIFFLKRKKALILNDYIVGIVKIWWVLLSLIKLLTCADKGRKIPNLGRMCSMFQLEINCDINHVWLLSFCRPQFEKVAGSELLESCFLVNDLVLSENIDDDIQKWLKRDRFCMCNFLCKFVEVFWFIYFKFCLIFLPLYISSYMKHFEMKSFDLCIEMHV